MRPSVPNQIRLACEFHSTGRARMGPLARLRSKVNDEVITVPELLETKFAIERLFSSVYPHMRERSGEPRSALPALERLLSRKVATDVSLQAWFRCVLFLLFPAKVAHKLRFVLETEVSRLVSVEITNLCESNPICVT